MVMSSLQQIRGLAISVLRLCFATKVTLGRRGDHEPPKGLKGPWPQSCLPKAQNSFEILCFRFKMYVNFTSNLLVCIKINTSDTFQ